MLLFISLVKLSSSTALAVDDPLITVVRCSLFRPTQSKPCHLSWRKVSEHIWANGGSY